MSDTTSEISLQCYKQHTTLTPLVTMVTVVTMVTMVIIVTIVTVVTVVTMVTPSSLLSHRRSQASVNPSVC